MPFFGTIRKQKSPRPPRGAWHSGPAARAFVRLTTPRPLIRRQRVSPPARARRAVYGAPGRSQRAQGRNAPYFLGRGTSSI